MFERFTKDARAVVERAREEARDLGSPNVEAEHLLLAASERSPGLAGAELDHDAILAALDAEGERALASVGVTASEYDLPPARPHAGTPRWGTSAKLAMQRSLKAAVRRGDRRILAAHVLLGVLQAPAGTVPRALEAAGVDRMKLASRVEAGI